MQYTLIDPKNDFAFKYIFGNIRNKNILLAFLNAFICETERTPLTDLEFVDTHLQKTKKEGKLSILDVLVKTADGKHINIEIQVSDEHNMIERTVHYASRIHGEQMVSGQDYETVKKTISINIVDFCLFPFADYHSYFHYHCKRANYTLTDKVEIHYIELPKLTPTNTSLDKKEDWCAFLQQVHPDYWKGMTIDMPELKKAQEQLKYLSHDETLRLLAIQQDKARMDHISSLNRAERKGKLEGKLEEKRENAKNFLALGLDAATVSQGTGLSIEEVLQLQAELIEVIVAPTKET